MVRDRLDELREKSKESQRNSKKKDIAVELEEDPLKNVFSIAQEITDGIDKISSNIDLCRYYMKQILESPFREKDLSEKLTEIFQENGKFTHIIDSKLKQLGNKIKTRNESSAVGRIEAIQYNTLKTRFRNCIREDNEEMQNFKSFRINSYKAQLRVKGMNIREEELTELLQQDAQIFTDNLLIETAEAKRLLSEAEELNQQLLKIERLITEVRDIFVQMSVLVEEQQELIDVVEYQTQQAVDFVERIPKTLKDAEGKKRKAFKMKLICFSIIVIFILILVLSFIYR